MHPFCPSYVLASDIIRPHNLSCAYTWNTGCFHWHSITYFTHSFLSRPSQQRDAKIGKQVIISLHPVRTGNYWRQLSFRFYKCIRISSCCIPSSYLARVSQTSLESSFAGRQLQSRYTFAKTLPFWTIHSEHPLFCCTSNRKETGQVLSASHRPLLVRIAIV